MGSDNNSSSTTSVPMSRFRASNLFNRFSLIMILVLVIICSSYFNHSLVLMTKQMKVDESEFQALKNTIDKQALLIQRFNNSITNTDVMKKVSSLSNELKSAELDMDRKMKLSQEKVANLLNNTLDQLARTVSAAEEQIHNEVAYVKGDVAKYASETNEKFSMENSFMIYQLAGTFTLIACLISMWHMTAHIRHFKRPFVQRKILAILWMSPIYGITSWLSLVFPQFEIYFGTIKDFYEAYTIYQFLSFLIGVLGRGNRSIVVDKLARHADHLEPPIRLFSCCTEDPYDTPKKKADGVLLQCQTFAMQFVFFKPTTAIGIFLCKKFYVNVGQPVYLTPKFWIIMLQNVSVFIAFSGLLKFYHAAQADFAWCRPFPKFLCIKGIVFMTFWQGLVISILADTTTAGRTKDASEAWAAQAQNFLICLEMLLFSVAHFYCFPTDEWQDGYQPVENKDTKFGDNIALRDFFDDLRLIVGSGGDNKKKKKRKGSKKNSDDSSTGTSDTKEDSPGGSSSISKSSNSPFILSDKTVENNDEEDQNLNGRRQASVKIIEEALGSLGNDSESNNAMERLRMRFKQTDNLLSSTDSGADNKNKSSYGYGAISGVPLGDHLHGVQDESDFNGSTVQQQSHVSAEATSLLSQPVRYEDEINSTTESTILLGQTIIQEEETNSTTKEPSLTSQQTLHEDRNSPLVENTVHHDQSVTNDQETIVPVEPTDFSGQSVINKDDDLQMETTDLLGQPVVNEEADNTNAEIKSLLSQPTSSGVQNSESTEFLRPSLFTLHNP